MITIELTTEEARSVLALSGYLRWLSRSERAKIESVLQKLRAAANETLGEYATLSDDDMLREVTKLASEPMA